MPGRNESEKSPFSPTKLSLNIEKNKSEQTKSPKPASSIMSSWLSKSASKKEAAKPAESAKKDENCLPTSKLKKTISARLSEAFSDTEEHMEKAVEAKPSATQKRAAKAAEEKPAKKASKPAEEKPARKTSKPAKQEEAPAGEEAKAGKDKKPGNKFYAAYMHRSGPKAPGSKPVPIGKADCFAGLKFLVSGVLESMERDECKKIIEKYGGACISGVTKKLDYLVVGEDAGQAKIEKAKELNTKVVNEDEFLQLIITKSGIKNPTYESADCEMACDLSDEEEPKKPAAVKPQIKTEASERMDLEVKAEPAVATVKAEPMELAVKAEPAVATVKAEVNDNVSQLWVDKYKPTKMSKIIGQSTEKSNAPKLFNWLKNWHKYHGAGADKAAKKGWNDQETGSSFKCALLSGPPGIGKTTTATLVAKEAGYTYIEFNASDSRSKKLLDKVLGESVESCSIDSYFRGRHRADDAASDRHCIIMDEVDGMAGTEDRGGILELINTIKHSKIPIICICNDRQHVKIRSLANYCFDLRFYKPRIEQVRAALMSVCFKEGIKMTGELLDQVIVSCNYDIRQCLHNLSMWASNSKCMTANAATKGDIERAMKDTRMNPFEACKQVFSHEGPKTVNEKMEFFFTDYSLMPLLVQENYVSVRPATLSGSTKSQRDCSHLQLLAAAADSIVASDRIGRLIRTNNNWSLLPAQAVFATVIPGERLHGSIGLPAFPAWFGKNSKQGRVDRILQELQKHMRMHISANKVGVGLDYLSVLKNMLSQPLVRKGAAGIDQVIAVMNEYSLTRDDFDTILELATWSGSKDPMAAVDSKVKAAFTRAYNKQAHLNPFSIVDVKKLKVSRADEEGAAEEVESSEGEEDKDDVTKDAMIKVKAKSKVAPVAKTSGVKRGAKTDAPKPSAKKKKV